jgi:hypothetical protein
MTSPNLPKRRPIRLLVAAATLPLVLLLPALSRLAEIAQVDVAIQPLAIGFAGTAVWLFVVAMAVVRQPTTQNVLVTVASVSFCLALGEIGFRYLNASGALDITSDEVHVADPDLGYRLPPGQKITAREVSGEKVIFNVTYTVDANGYRMTPAGPRTAPCRALFFGDSFTFGWGLPDDQTIPNQFMIASEGQYSGYNLSISGYGPHQMLQLLQTGRVDRLIGEGPVHLVVYQGLYAHVARAAGRTNWDLRGPRYALAEGGEAVTYVGPFHRNGSASLLRLLLHNSEIFTFLHQFAVGIDLPRAEDVPLYMAILKQTKREVERRYARGAFVVVFWQVQDEVEESGLDLLNELAEAGLDVVPVSRILPDLDLNRKAYALAPLDWHPNRVAAYKIAQFLAREVGVRQCHPDAREVRAP